MSKEVRDLPKRILAFRSQVVDDLRIAAGTPIPAGTSFSFLTDYSGLNEDRVTDVSEPDILKDLLTSGARNLILEELGVSNECPIFFEVKNPVVQFGEKPGDIDLLIYLDGRADKAIGIQCKRVKVEALDQNEDKCNKISSIAEGVRQANLQRRNFGFHQNYLAILIETYGRLRDKSNTVFRGPTSETFNEIYNITQDERTRRETKTENKINHAIRSAIQLRIPRTKRTPSPVEIEGIELPNVHLMERLASPRMRVNIVKY